MGVDSFLKSLPGSPQFKAAAASGLLVALLAVPVFGISKEGRQGHDYFSSERPEFVRAGEEQQRRMARKRREQEEEEQLKQQQRK